MVCLMTYLPNKRVPVHGRKVRCFSSFQSHHAGRSKARNLPETYSTNRSENQQQARANLKLADPRPIIGLCPGAEFGPAKRWYRTLLRTSCAVRP